MYSEFDKICEATLWDNLKRKANKTLRKIENIENTQKRLEIFTKPRFTEIQKLLDNIGKEFFRIFLYKAIKDGLSKNISIEETVKDFQFFFWPGYSTLKGQRIFIEGAKKPNSDIHRYFTGVGNKRIDTISFSTFYDYFFRPDNNPDLLTKESNLWVYNIPTTLAFDSIMNQFYLDIDAEKYGNLFIAGSTHHWKSSQKIPTKDGINRYLPMPLKNDSSELRILEVKVDTEISYSLIKNKENKISFTIPENQLNRSGEIIADKLHPDCVPVRLNLTDKPYFILWPNVLPDKNVKNLKVDDSVLYNLQKLAYSYWISETLSNLNTENVLSYTDIRKEFKINGFDYLAKRVQPFQKRVHELKQDKEFTELYYNYWYTLFLESYGESVDLGTAMILSNHSYDSEFLMKCSHWIRWIFNELRLLEAKALEAITTEYNDIRKLSHHLNTNITALNYWVQKKVKPKIDIAKFQTTDYLISNIASYVFVSTNVNEKYQLNKTEFDLKKEIINTLSIFKILALNVELFNNVFRLGLPNKEIFKNYKNLSFVKYKLSKKVIFTDLDLVKLLLKDLFENLIKHSKYGEPDCRIEIVKENECLYLVILNTSWPTDETLEIMRNNHFGGTRTGWRNINRLIKLLNWDLQIPRANSEILYGDYFWIKVKIN